MDKKDVVLVVLNRDALEDTVKNLNPAIQCGVVNKNTETLRDPRSFIKIAGLFFCSSRLLVC